MSHLPYYGSPSGAKVIILFERAKSIHIFFYLSLLNTIELIAASFVAHGIKVRIRLRPSMENNAVLSCLY
jgi:hypothetical protein